MKIVTAEQEARTEENSPRSRHQPTTVVRRPRGRRVFSTSTCAKRYGGALERSRQQFWLVCAALLVVVGILGSVLGAHIAARTNAERSRLDFHAESMEIAATLNLAVAHVQDLAVSAGAFVADNPGASQADFLRWVSSVRAFERYPDLQSIYETTIVPAGQLSAFAAQEEADPTGLLAADGSFQVVPAGDRPYYCLVSGTQSRTPQQMPAGTDYCDAAAGSALLKSGDSGQDTYVPYRLGKTAGLTLGIPVYSGGAVPGTAAARRAALIGWTGMTILPSVILDEALEHRADTAVSIGFSSESTKVAFSEGSAPIAAQSTTINLHNGWRVLVTRGISKGRALVNRDALFLLLGGIVLSLTMGGFLYLLGSGRSRAMRLARERTDQLRHQALHDSLTGLPNRTLVLDRIDQMLARARRSQFSVAALVLDLDDFKDINDSLGHGAGDQLLAAVGLRLASTLREVDTVGRLGGDEFVVLAEGDLIAAGAEVVAARILNAMEPPFDIAASDLPVSVTASIGIATGDRSTPEEVLRDADIALYRAKAGGKRGAVVFAPSMQLVVDDHRRLIVDLHQAVAAGQFFLLYQPTVDLSTGACTGVEALLRWRHPERGVIPPDDFIPALESSNLILPVGQWVLEEACRQGMAWHEQGYRIAVSVNVSVRQLERDRIIEDVHAAVARSGFDSSMLILEVTETTLMHDVPATLARLTLLKALGVRLAIDDFGTGYSSLAYLRQFPVDVLKIDRAFVSAISETKEAAALVHTLVQLGKVLGLETIAEGVETDDQRARLRAEEVDGGQGYLFARPLEVPAVNRLLKADADQRRVSVARGDVP
jgi:diguanylate cyclase (GGDEF)-like protein